MNIVPAPPKVQPWLHEACLVLRLGAGTTLGGCFVSPYFNGQGFRDFKDFNGWGSM